MLEDLIAEYEKYFLNENKNGCLKIHYQCNNVSVNLFFDAYDKKSLALCIVLSYDKEDYLTSLNVRNILETNKTIYLKECPKLILHQILSSERKMDSFYKNMREHIRDYIVKSKNQQINLKCDYGDKSFQNALEKSKNQQYRTPFLHHIRNTTMSEKQLTKLRDELDIPEEILIKLQTIGRTIVTTNDSLKRRTLTMILEEVGYKV